jgi:pSer/pThr/pTyr-binding forkhead associated (FHA) protein
MKITVKMPSDKLVEKFSEKEQVSFGRSQKCDIIIAEEALSRQHCLIELHQGEFFITDLNSSNGVYIDGNRIPSQTRTPYATFQALNIGPLECQLSDELPSDQTTQNSHLTRTGQMLTSPTRKMTSGPRKSLKIEKHDEKENSKIFFLASMVLLLTMLFYFIYAFLSHSGNASIPQNQESVPEPSEI